MGTADGSPGTGKTLATKTVAEMAGKPLYLVRSENVGTEPEAAEKYLQLVLSLSRTWDYTVLLDEAEIFPERRRLNDPKPNALVPVFLRVVSLPRRDHHRDVGPRGHVRRCLQVAYAAGLHYEKLDRGQRRQAGRNFLNHLKSLGVGDIDDDDVERCVSGLAEYAINGREIRNSITTAR